MKGSSAASEALDTAKAAAALARRSGCGIDEAGEAVTTGLERRRVLAGGLVLGAAAVLPRWMTQPLSARRSAERVVIVGSGIAGLGCAYRLWKRHGVKSEVYEFNTERPGGRIYTLRGYFDGGQYAEQHGEFISTEHTAMRALVRRFGLHLDNADHYPPGTRANEYQFRFGGKRWSQEALNHDWHTWAWQLFNEAAFVKAPWPTLYDRGGPWAGRWDAMSCAEWIAKYVPGGMESDFGRLCQSILLDEYGGEIDQQSALNLVYLLGEYDSAPSDRQPKGSPELSGTDEKWHIHGGNDQVVTELVQHLPAGTVRLGQQLVAIKPRGHGRWACTFADGTLAYEIVADQVVLALPFTKLREVDTTGLDLPPQQRRAIDTEPLGSNSKIQLQFSSKVWNKEHWTANAYTDEVAQGTWETTVDQPGTSGILIGLPGGAGGADIGERYKLSSYYGEAPEAMVNDYLRCYEGFWPGIRHAYSGKAYYAWSSGDPHIGGAYSYLKVGQYTSFNGMQGRPLGSLHFAGEHTSVNFQGYMEGGLRSGYRCADEIAG